MGYKRGAIVLKFDESNGDMAGFECRLSRMSMAKLLEISHLADLNVDSNDEIEEAWDRLTKHIADHLLSWNLEEDDGTPVIPSLETVRALDGPFVMLTVRAWLNAATAVPLPLSQPSKDGVPSLEQSIPMEIESPNQPS